MKQAALILFLILSVNVFAESERFQLNEAELTEMTRARLVKPVTLHSSCKSISSIDRLSASGKIPTGKKIDLVLVSKKTRQTYLLSGDSLVYKFTSTFGSGYRNGPKIQEGDGRTPEGIYSLDYKNYDSKFHKSIHISYPSAADQKFANDHGVTPGGDVMIHGVRGWFGTGTNWTAGCIAMKNEDIDKLMSVVLVPTTVAICPL